jgi:hypothetical protein
LLQGPSLVIPNTQHYIFLKSCPLQQKTKMDCQEHHNAIMQNKFTAISKTTKKVGPKTQGYGCSTAKLNNLFDLIEEHLPSRHMEWELIEKVHGVVYPDTKRTKETLKQKFACFYQKYTQTSNPSAHQAFEKLF